MNDVLAARSQMGISLGFHIIFACIGMVMPFFMAVAHFKWLKTGQERYKNITKAWSKGVAIFFVTGAVSGTMLSFELGLLWPGFMKYAGPIIGMPFSLEGTAFFIEAIALGFFLYGWDTLNRWFHWFTGLVVGLTGLASGILVVAANAWMNAPTGFVWNQGHVSQVHPFAAMMNQAWIPEALHMVLAAFAATGFAVAGVHAWMVYRKKNIDFHWKSFRIAATFAALAALVQPISGDLAAKSVARLQPAKLAAMEALFHTQSAAPLLLGGLPDNSTASVSYGIEIPHLLSLLAFDNPQAVVKGLDQIPKEDKPPVTLVHLCFQLMVLLGTLMSLVGLVYIIGEWKNASWIRSSRMLKAFILCIPAGFVAVESGWVVTEVGRQPWIIYGFLKTRDAVTPMPGISYTFYVFSAIYLLLAVMVIFLLYRQIRMVPYVYDSESGGR